MDKDEKKLSNKEKYERLLSEIKGIVYKQNLNNFLNIN